LTIAAARTGPMKPEHRQRIEEILVATGVFRPEEVQIALELFDEAMSDQPDHAARSAQHAADTRSISSTNPDLSLSSPSSYCFLGAFTPEDELTGFACYGPTPGTDRTFDLYWIAVHPSAQGTGSGTILLSEVERRLEDTDARLFVVETSSRPEYDPTRAFYRARGWAEAARMRDFYAPSDDRVIFTKRFRTPRQGQGAASR
jgi:GNAT superfamily N-acetyltransferase